VPFTIGSPIGAAVVDVVLDSSIDGLRFNGACHRGGASYFVNGGRIVFQLTEASSRHSATTPV